MVDSEGLLKIMDLGLAKHHFEGDASMTTTGMIMGSPHFMSPEQIQDSKSVDHRSDLYSLGIVFYQMLTGKVPFPETSGTAVIMKHLHEEIPPLKSLRPDINEPVDDLVSRLAARERDKRPASATAFLEELQPWIERNPFDETASHIWADLDFKPQRVESVLEREKIDPRKVDSEINPLLPTLASPKSRRGALVWMGAVLMVAAVLFHFVTRPGHSVPAPQAVAAGTVQPGAKVGGLLVKTQPLGATVMFQAQARTSPATFEQVPVGDHSVKISMTGYAEANRQVSIRAGEFSALNIELIRADGRVTIISDPPGADVYVRDQRMGRTPLQLPGMHGTSQECQLQLKGYRKKSANVVFADGGHEHFERMEPEGGPGRIATTAHTDPSSPSMPGTRPLDPQTEQQVRQSLLPLLQNMVSEKDREQFTKEMESGQNIEAILKYITPQNLDPAQLAQFEQMKQRMMAGSSDNAARQQAMQEALAAMESEPAGYSQPTALQPLYKETLDETDIKEFLRSLQVGGVSIDGQSPTATISNLVVEQGKTYSFPYGDRFLQCEVIKIESDKITLRHEGVEETVSVGSDLGSFMEK